MGANGENSDKSGRYGELGTIGTSSELVPSSLAELGTRISAVADRIGTRKYAASTIGISTDQLQKWIRGKNEPGVLSMVRLAQAGGVSLDWLATGAAGASLYKVAEPEPDAAVAVKVFRCSDGSTIWDDGSLLVGSIRITTALANALVGYGGGVVIGFVVAGREMRPELDDGDIALVDYAPGKASLDGIYAIVKGGEVVFRHLLILGGARYRVTVGESLGQSFEVDRWSDSLMPLGRCISVWHRR